MKRKRVIKNIFKIVSLMFVVMFFSGARAGAESLVLQPGADEGEDANWYSYPYHSNNYNYGGLSCLEMSHNHVFQGRGLIRFDMPLEMEGADILNATLSLYAYDTAASYDNVIYVNRAVSFWEELPAGTIFSPPSYDALYQVSGVISSTTPSQVDFDITDMVHFWALNPEDNYGMVLATDEVNINRSVYSYIFSSDYSNTSWHPRLSIEYVPCSAPEPASCMLFGIGAILAVLRRGRGSRFLIQKNL